jgi:hypothetical protein
VAGHESFGGAPNLSQSEYAKESDDPVGNVSHHVEALDEAGVVEVASMVPRSGAMEHRYSFAGEKAGMAIAVMELLATS